MMTGNTKTILEVKKEISLLLSEVHYVSNCVVEFDSKLQVNKIVIIINDESIEKSLIKILLKFSKYGYRIVIRKNPDFTFFL